LYRQRNTEEVHALQSSRLVLGGGGRALPSHLRQVGLGFGRLRVPDLFLHVDYVSDNLCARNLRTGATREEGLVVHCHGDYGRGRAAKGDGLRRRSLRSVTRIYRADVLLRVRGVLRLHVAAAKQWP